MSRSTSKIGTGVKAVGTGLRMLGGTDVPAYTLEFLTNSEKHAANSNKTIVVPYAELGRDRECVIHFGNDLPMVSKKHAAIEMRGQETFLKQLSQTNQTLINGRPVNSEWYLTNGDEIQLSASGPRIRFLATATKTSTIGVSKRIQLFAQQSLRPYRQALVAMLLLIIAGGAIAAYLITNLRVENKNLQQAYAKINEQTEQQKEAIKKGNAAFLASQKEMANKLAASNKEKAEMRKNLDGLSKSLEELKKKPPPAAPTPAKDVVPVVVKAQPLLSQQIEEVRKHVYFLKMYLTVDGEFERTYVGSGTGFLLDDGRFITARHCIQPWAYASLEMNKESDEMWLVVNWLYYNTPKGKVKLEVELTSPENTTILLDGDKFIKNESQDLYYSDIDLGYGAGKIQLASLEDGQDWAYYTVGAPKKIGIKSDAEMASDLKSGTTIHVLGYTFGLGNSGEAPSPFYSAANVSQNGLVNGLINVSNLGFAEGNSGGPVFVEKDGQLINVGIVSAGNSVLGMVVPISATK